MGKIFKEREYQAELIQHFHTQKRVAGWASMGSGKAQPVGEPVLTPTGWKPIGALKVGDEIIGSNGSPTQVLGVFPQGVKEVYEVSCNDGSSTLACLEHLWSVSVPGDRDNYRVMSTAQLLQRGLHDGAGNRKWSIPLVSAVKHSHKSFPVEPYLLGVILGDGCTAGGRRVSITTDDEILEHFIERFDTRVEAHVSEGISTLNIKSSKIRKGLQELGLMGKRSWEKVFPEQYLLGSVEQRLRLLHGLMDTDGSATQVSGTEFSSTSESLANGVVALARSLGGVARKSGARRTFYQNGIGRPSWRVNVKLPKGMLPFSLSRKLKMWTSPTKYPVLRAIKSISPHSRQDCVCISVAANDSLYVTKDYIVTHNTVSSLTYVSDLMDMGMNSPTLVLAPLLVAKTSWVDEARKWDHLSGLRVVPVVGNEKDRRRALRYDANVFATNYESLPWLQEYFGSRWPFETVIADEATRLKSFRLRQGSKRAKALAKVAHTKVKRFIELSGTPAPNGLQDLWGQLWFLDGGKRLGRSYQAFKDRWFETGYDGFSMRAREFSEGQIHDAVSDICLTIDMRDYLDIGEPIVTNKYVDLPARARDLYKDMEDRFFMEIEGHEVEALNAGAKSQKLFQLASGAVYVDPLVEDDSHPKATMFKEVHDAKIQILESIVNEANGMPVFVAYRFKSDAARLLKAFPKGAVLTSANGVELMPKWNRGEIPIMFAHPASAGHGLSLQDGGNILVYFSMDWNLEHRLQILERIGPARQFQAGHDRPVFVYNILSRDTVDELALARCETKKDVQDILMEAVNNRRKL